MVHIAPTRIYGANRFTLAAAMKQIKSTRRQLHLAAAFGTLTDAPFGTICGIRVALTLINMALILQPTACQFLLVILRQVSYQIVDRRGYSLLCA